ncbi:MAG TPA: antibiotic biosynthesis monooxygenase [Baekduia sp.]|jgi:quinol monooxygenase YgiN
MSVTKGLLVVLEAKPGRADELAQFLGAGRDLALAEPETVTWYAFRLGETTFGIFDTFAAESGREAHLNGEIAQALGRIAPDLLAEAPSIRPVDVLAVKEEGAS